MMKINCKKLPIILIVIILSCNSKKSESKQVEVNELNQKNLNVSKSATKDDEMPDTGIDINANAAKIISLDVIKENSKKEIENKLKEKAAKTATAVKKAEDTKEAVKKAKDKKRKEDTTKNKNKGRTNNNRKPKTKATPKPIFITFNTDTKKPKTNNSTKTNTTNKPKSLKKRKQFSEAKIKHRQNIDFRSNEKIIIETKKSIEYGDVTILSHTLLTAYYTRNRDRLILKFNPIIINDKAIILDKLQVMDYGDKLIGLKANLIYIKANQRNKKTVNKLLNTGTALITRGVVGDILNENVEEKANENARLETYILEKDRPILIKNLK